MSGYLEVKYPFKSNLGLNPFKTWKRQWCILRPSPTCSGGGSLAVYCSEAGASAGAVQLPPESVVRRAKSRSRPHAFAVFSALEPLKPRILLAAQTYQDAQLWMDKIKALLDGRKWLGTELLKNSYSVTIITSELSRKLGLSGDGLVSLSTQGVLLSRSQTLEMLIEWKHVRDATQLTDTDKNKICVLNVHSGFHNGGSLQLSTPLAAELVAALSRDAGGRVRQSKRLTRSEGDLRATDQDADTVPSCYVPSSGAALLTCFSRGTRRSSWCNGGPPEVALDDTDLLMLKESERIPRGALTRCAGAGHLPPARARLVASATMDDCTSDRRSLLSIASGIYEEIPEPPDQPYTNAPRDALDALDAPAPRRATRPPESKESGAGGSVEWWARAGRGHEEPTYESVAECVYGTWRRAARRPPPLPPRLPVSSAKLGAGWGARAGCDVTRHSSLGSLPRCYSLGAAPDDRSTKTLPKDRARQAFSVFRKRLKSDSRITSPKSETAKENKDIETKKKKFDFTPTRELFKNFKVSRKMKNLKIAPGSLSKAGETKSCEFLDETEHVTAARCSKSVECLEGNDEFLDEFDGNLSLDFNDDAVAALSLPQEIVELILRGEHLNKIRLKTQLSESDYMPMSPIVPPPPIEHHYIAMSPRTNLAN